MKYYYLFILLFFVISCEKNSYHEINIDDIFDEYIRNVYRVNNKAELENLVAEIKNTAKILKNNNSPYVGDFEYLLKLYNAKTMCTKFENPDLGFKYIVTNIRERKQEQLVAHHQKEAPKCLVFDPIKDSAYVDKAFENICNDNLIFNKKTYKYSDAVKKWMQLQGFENNDEAKKELSNELITGICRGIEKFANYAFYENININEYDLARAVELNYVAVLEGQIKGNIISYLIEKKERDFTSIYNQSREGYYDFKTSFRKFLPAHSVKKFIKNEILEKLSGPAAIYLGFRSGFPHAVSLQIIGNKYRIIDNNVGILVFNNEEQFLEAIAGYIVRFYGENHQPETVFYIKNCP